MRNLLIAISIALFSFPSYALDLTSSAQATQDNASFNINDHLPEIKQAESYLNNLDSLKSQFQQIHSADGAISRGMFYLSKPGKLRLDYETPKPVKLYINDTSVVVYNERLDQISYSSIDSLWSKLLQGKDVDLVNGDLLVVNALKTETTFTITVADKKALREYGPHAHRVSLQFETAPYRLARLQWMEHNGQLTTFNFINPAFDIALDDELFTFTNPRLYQQNHRRSN